MPKAWSSRRSSRRDALERSWEVLRGLFVVVGRGLVRGCSPSAKDIGGLGSDELEVEVSWGVGCWSGVATVSCASCNTWTYSTSELRK